MTQIGVSYLVLILYVSSVVTFTLLVGLLPVYVNPPECKPDEINTINQIGEVERASKLSECIEFTTPEVGIEEPWFNPRLPTNIQPLEYEIEINALSKIYDGKLSVKLVLTDQTDTFIVHKKLNSVQVEAMFDKDNVEIPIACYGEYPKNDYYIFKTVNYIRPEQSPLDIRFGFSGSLEVYESGLFDIEFGNEPDIKSLTVSKFEPLNARKAYPCFDEPNLKATYKFTINHANDSIVLSNTEQESEESINGTIRTYFKQTPKLPTYLLSLVVFNQDDFKFKQDVTESNIQVKIWARRELIDAGFLDEPLAMAIRLINTLEKLLPEIASDLPRKIDIFASPLYPSDGIGHWGLPIFREERIIFNNNSAGERVIQDVALLMAEKLAEFFFGNYVTFSWWDELWLQEALSDYLKYRMVDEAYPEWNIYEQFITDELIDVLIEDGYPSSHPVVKQVNSPYEIEEYFDRVERSKVAAVLRMIEDETSKSRMLTALQTYLEANAWGNGNSILFFSQLGMIRDWRVTDFVDRWFKQSNYPLLTVSTRQIAGNRWIVSFNQKRALNLNNSTSILYPSPYDWRWYIPVTCLFGKDSQVDKFLYNISESDQSSLIGDGNTEYDWFHCGYKFLGYFSAIYPKSNWDALKVALSNDINILEPSDRANLLHNIFMNAMTNHSSYFDLVDFLSILSGEQDYLPWRTIHKHFNEIGPILEYKRSFYQLSSYFTNILSNFFVNYDQSNQTHIKRLLWESNYELQCKLENSMFIRNASDLWYSNMQAILELTDPTNNMIDPLLREVVYKYHIQNTYDVDEWFLALQVYRSYRDFTEKRRLFEALAFTRVPGLLAEYFFNSNDEMMDIFERIGHVSKNVYGRYLTWTYYRTNYETLVSEFGLDEPRLGQALIDISYTFESDEMLLQLTDFIEKTVPGATKNARVKALERVTANLIWLELKENEIFEAFHLGNRTNFL